MHDMDCFPQDHYFDVVTNVVGLAAAVLGDKFYWWIDPIGAIALAVYTITNWSWTVWENAGLCTCSSETIGLLCSSTYTNLKECNIITC
jgi:Co/Zn/Cd efflux system component